MIISIAFYFSFIFCMYYFEHFHDGLVCKISPPCSCHAFQHVKLMNTVIIISANSLTWACFMQISFYILSMMPGRKERSCWEENKLDLDFSAHLHILQHSRILTDTDVQTAFCNERPLHFLFVWWNSALPVIKQYIVDQHSEESRAS